MSDAEFSNRVATASAPQVPETGLNKTTWTESPGKTPLRPILLRAATQRTAASFMLAMTLAVAFFATKIDESDRSSESLVSSPMRSPTKSLASSFRIDINDADQKELMLLPGVGQKTANAILDDRRANGPFESVQDLTRVRGIGVKTILEIEPYCWSRSAPQSPALAKKHPRHAGLATTGT